MALHTGTPHPGPEGYVGVDIHRGARIGAAGHGGQVLVSAASAAVLGTEGLRDLGLHRFLGPRCSGARVPARRRGVPALKSLYRANLPVPATPSLGREREIPEVVALLTQQNLRLLTRTGPGGTGETRLALQAVAEASLRKRDAANEPRYWMLETIREYAGRTSVTAVTAVPSRRRTGQCAAMLTR